MELYRVEATVEENGKLTLEHLPFSEGEKVEIVVTRPKATHPGWPAGYFERTAGAIKDESFIRHPEGEYDERLWAEVMARVEARHGKYPALSDDAYSTDTLYD